MAASNLDATNTQMKTVVYDDAIVRAFSTITVVWGSGELSAPAAHERRDLRVRRQHDVRRHLLLHPAAAEGAHGRTTFQLGHFWGWQLIIVCAAHHAARSGSPRARNTPS
jgi:hypothetical protein